MGTIIIADFELFIIKIIETFYSINYAFGKFIIVSTNMSPNSVLSWLYYDQVNDSNLLITVRCIGLELNQF